MERISPAWTSASGRRLIFKGAFQGCQTHFDWVLLEPNAQRGLWNHTHVVPPCNCATQTQVWTHLFCIEDRKSQANATLQPGQWRTPRIDGNKEPRIDIEPHPIPKYDVQYKGDRYQARRIRTILANAIGLMILDIVSAASRLARMGEVTTVAGQSKTESKTVAYGPFESNLSSADSSAVQVFLLNFTAVSICLTHF